MYRICTYPALNVCMTSPPELNMYHWCRVRERFKALNSTERAFYRGGAALPNFKPHKALFSGPPVWLRKRLRRV